MNLSTWSIRHPVPPIALFLVLLLAGFYSFRTLAVTQFPNIDLPIERSWFDYDAAFEITVPGDGQQAAEDLKAFLATKGRDKATVAAVETRKFLAEPLVHFLLVGGQEGRSPGPWFDTQRYVACASRGLNRGAIRWSTTSRGAPGASASRGWGVQSQAFLTSLRTMRAAR